MPDPFVLHVRLVTGVGGGPDKTILNSPRHLVRRGYRCECAYLHPPGDPGFSVLAERARQSQAPLIPIEDRGPLDLRVIRELVRICRERRVAIWHGHEYKSNVFGLLARRFWPMKLVTTVHGWGVHAGRAPLYNGIDRRVLRFYDQVICVSADLRDECLRYGVRPHRCVVIENAIDVEQFRRNMTTAAAKAEVQAPPAGVLLGAVGRLSEEKRFDLLIAAVARLRESGQDIHLWIAGEGPEREKLANQIAALRLEDRVRLLGMVADPRPLLQALDALVLSSEREGLPNVVLEAMAMETPVIATRVAGVPNLLDHGRLGILVAPGSVETLVEGIEIALRDREAHARLAADALQRIHDRHTFDYRMDLMTALYGQILGRQVPSRGEELLQTA